MSSLARQLARPCVLDAAPYTWVRPDDPGDLILLDANENAWGPRGKPLGTDVSRYPQIGQDRLRAALAGYAGVRPTEALATVGADEAIDILVRTFCEPGEDSVAVLAPMYPMYRRQAAIGGVQVRETAMALWESGDAMSMARDLGDAKLTFVCRPNNPTGLCLSIEALRALLGAAPGYLVVDEAYIEFSDDPRGVSAWVGQEPRLIVLRTLSKAFGLAGLRFGYILADADTIAVLDLVRLPFNVGAVSAHIATEALADVETLHRIVGIVREERERLAAELSRLPGVDVVPSQANFIFIRVAGAPKLCDQIQASGVLIRDRSSISGCGDSIRITVGRPEENERLLFELRRCLEETC